MRAGHGGSLVGRLRYAHTAKVSEANTAAMIRLGMDFICAASWLYQLPVLGIDFHGSAGARRSPFCSSSIEMLSGERTNAMRSEERRVGKEGRSRCGRRS